MTSPRLCTEEQQQLPAASSYPPFCVLKEHGHPLGLPAVGIICAVLILYRADFFFYSAITVMVIQNNLYC